MATDIDIVHLRELLVDTLAMICLNPDHIDRYLEELEGDYHTFFDADAIAPLRTADVLNDNQVKIIIELKAYIATIPLNLWNKSSFRNAVEWSIARMQANLILNSLENK